MIAVNDHPGGAVLPVRAKPGSKVNAVIDEHAGALRVSVTAAPDKGKANEAIIELLADWLNLKKAQITLIGGATSRSKRFLIEGIDRDDLLARIEAAFEPTLFDPPDAEV